jgi:hypothetical protein
LFSGVCFVIIPYQTPTIPLFMSHLSLTILLITASFAVAVLTAKNKPRYAFFEWSCLFSTILWNFCLGLVLLSS